MTEETQNIPQSENQDNPITSWKLVKWLIYLFPFLVFYIYNSLHTTKAIKKKDELSKQLKELHSERISLESEITQSSKQSEIAEKLKETGLKELSDPPIKIVREKKD